MNPNEERLREIQKTIGEFADVVPQSIVDSWVNGDFNLKDTLQWVGTAVSQWRIENQKAREDAYRDVEALQLDATIFPRDAVKRDEYFQGLHEKASLSALGNAKREIDEGWYRHPSLLLNNATAYYQYTMSANYFFPLMDNEELYKSIPEAFRISNWNGFGNNYDKDYEKSKEVKYFADNNPWFILTSLFYCHRNWLKHKEGKDFHGVLFE